MGRRRQGWVLVALAAVVALAGCQVKSTVDVDVAADGSGTVAVTVDLDRTAAQQLADLDRTVLLGDLRAKGWRIDGPRRTASGGARIAVSRPFRDPDELTAVMAQLTGPRGPVRDFRLRRRHQFAKTSYRLTGTVDLQRGIDAFSDDELTMLLGGKPFGRSPAELEFLAGGRLPEHLRLALRVRLPGGTAGAPARDGQAGVWSPKLGDPAVRIDATGTRRSPVAWVLAALAGFSALVALAATARLIRLRAIERPPRYVHVPGAATKPWEELTER